MSNQLSTIPLKPLTTATGECVPLAWLTRLEMRFSALYGTRFKSLIATKEQHSEWIEAWRSGIDGLTAEQIKTALDICAKQHEWPPSPAEFRSLCVPSIDYEKLFIDAANGKLTEKLTYWSAQSFGIFELRQMSYPAAKEKWRKIVDTMASESTLPNVPEPRAALPAPGQTMSREEALKGVETVKKVLTGCDKEFRRWATHPKSQKAVDLAISGDLHAELAEARENGYVIGGKWISPERRGK